MMTRLFFCSIRMLREADHFPEDGGFEQVLISYNEWAGRGIEPGQDGFFVGMFD